MRMKAKAESSISVKHRLLALAQTITTLSLIGLGAIIASIILSIIMDPIWGAVIIILSIIYLWLIVPIFEILTAVALFTKWKAISIVHEKEDEKRIDRIIRYLLFAVFACALISVLPYIFIGLFGSGSAIRHIWSFMIEFIGIYIAYKSFFLCRKIPCQLLMHAVLLFSIVACLASITFKIYIAGYYDYLLQSISYAKKAPTYSGSSESLNLTIIVPTLDSPIEENKNVIWSSVFQLALSELPDDVTNVFGEFDETDNMAPESYYTAVGKVSDGIIDVIKNDMAENFPKHSMPQFDKSDGLLVYSYLDLHVPFKYPFAQYKERFEFTDSQGKQTNISAFGLWESIKYGQVELLYSSLDPEEYKDGKHVKEFVIDLCKYSEPYQVIVSVVEPNETLTETINYVEKKIEDFKLSKDPSNRSEYFRYDILLVPEMFWHINHKFQDIQNVDAYQEMSLRFDRSGTVREDKSSVMKKIINRRFECNRPFMLYIKKRGSTQPCFVMWIDNAELFNKN